MLIILEGLLPALLLTVYIWWKDKYQHEPVSQILRGLWFGVLSIVVSMLISGPISTLNLCNDNYQDALGALKLAFLGAAIPEETAKLIMLWFLVRKNPWFDERMDGIVYAVCIGMGFAGLENIGYLFQNADNLHTIAVQRALFSVPGHFAFAVLMGYYYGLVHFEPKRYGHLRLLIWLAPVLAHGIFDMLLMEAPVFNEVIQFIIYFIFVIFCIRMHRFGSRRVQAQLRRDKSDFDTQGYVRQSDGSGEYDRG